MTILDLLSKKKMTKVLSPHQLLIRYKNPEQPTVYEPKLLGYKDFPSPDFVLIKTKGIELIFLELSAEEELLNNKLADTFFALEAKE